MLADASEQAFARHETFHPRFGWLRKAVAGAGDGTAQFLVRVGRTSATMVQARA